MQASKPSSSAQKAHFAGPPAMPTARAPRIFASCPTTWPTAPLAALTTTVSPGWTRATFSSPWYAVKPVIPSTPTAVEAGPREVSHFWMGMSALFHCTSSGAAMLYSCHP